MPKISQFAKFAMVLAMVLGACQSDGLDVPRATSTAFDGSWTGSARGNGSGRNCTAMMPITATVTNGGMVAYVTDTLGQRTRVQATIAPDGEAEDIEVSTSNLTSVSFSFEGDEASGSFQNPVCRGWITLHRDG